MGIAIECKNLTKTYGKVEVLKKVDIALEENKIYGLLGRNGAGKTTLLNLICGQTIRDQGTVEIFHEEAFENARAMERVCLVKEKDIPLEDYKVKKILELAKILYKNWDEDYKEYLVKEFKLDLNKKYGNLSRGNKSIVGIIIGLSSRADITIFDEPSLGLDAAVREKFYNLLLQDYEDHKRTIIISTHLIDEVSNLFEEVIILDKGQVLLKKDIGSLLEGARFLSGRAETMMPLIKNKKILHQETFGSTAIVGVIGDFTEKDLEVLKLNNIEISPMSLQKLFIYITEESDN